MGTYNETGRMARIASFNKTPSNWRGNQAQGSPHRNLPTKNGFIPATIQ